MKKILFILLTLSVFAAILTKVDLQKSKVPTCAFCDSTVLESQTFFKKGSALGILTHKPAVPGHVLIIPERHVERYEALTAEELTDIHEVVRRVDRAIQKKFGNKDYLILQKNGKEAGQSVPHVHFHYLPARSDLTFRFFLSPWLKADSDLEIKRLRETLSEEF